jgi:hypothetical protein
MIRACATSRDVLVSSRNELGRPANDAVGMVIIGVIIVALVLVILWASSWLGDLVEPTTRTGHVVIANILGEVQ